MAKIFIIGNGFLGEHLCKYFTEKYPSDEVAYFTDDFNLKIIDVKNYKISHVDALSKEECVDILINLNPTFEFIQILVHQFQAVKHFHQVLIKKNKRIEAFLQSCDFTATMSYSCQLYGPGQHEKELLPVWILRLLKNKTVEIKKNYERNWLFITDYCEAIDVILQKGKNKEIYNISSNVKVLDTEIVHGIIEMLNKTDNLIKIDDERIYNQTLEGTNLIKLGWVAKHTLDNALLLTIKWYLLDSFGEQIKSVIQLASKKR